APAACAIRYHQRGMNRILVIGGTGNIGRNVVTQVVAAGATVRAMVRDPDTAGLPPQVEVVRGDLTRPDTLKQSPRHIEAVLRVGDVVRWPYLAAPTAPIDERDIAAVACRALLEGGHADADYVLTGPESLTQLEQLSTIGRAIGRSLRIEEMSADETRREWTA